MTSHLTLTCISTRISSDHFAFKRPLLPLPQRSHGDEASPTITSVRTDTQCGVCGSTHVLIRSLWKRALSVFFQLIFYFKCFVSCQVSELISVVGIKTKVKKQTKTVEICTASLLYILKCFSVAFLRSFPNIYLAPTPPLPAGNSEAK